MEIVNNKDHLEGISMPGQVVSARSFAMPNSSFVIRKCGVDVGGLRVIDEDDSSLMTVNQRVAQISIGLFERMQTIEVNDVEGFANGKLRKELIGGHHLQDGPIICRSFDVKLKTRVHASALRNLHGVEGGTCEDANLEIRASSKSRTQMIQPASRPALPLLRVCRGAKSRGAPLCHLRQPRYQYVDTRASSR